MHNDTHDNTYKLAESDYQNALRQAFWHNLGNRLKRGCNDLLPYERVFKHLHQNALRNLGLQTVALDDIVGSAGRYADFDLAFRPRRKHDDGDERWIKVAHATHAAMASICHLLHFTRSAACTSLRTATTASR